MIRSGVWQRFVLAFLLGFASGCGDDDPRSIASGPTATPVATETPTGGDTREPCAQSDPLRSAFFGDLHVHTTYSFDAHAFEVRTTPAQAYRFAKGEPLTIPPLDAMGNGTQTVQIDRPLDFAAVTDHSEFLGEVEACSIPGSSTYESPTCQVYRGEDQNLAVRTFGLLLQRPAPRRIPDVCGSDGSTCRSLATDVWQRIQDAAESAYDRSSRCSFTSFVAYEYSAGTAVSTLHRNVIFRNKTVPFPTSQFEEPTAQGLRRQLQATCLDAGVGCDVLAIPHNPNESNGRMFFVEYPGATTIEEQRAQAMQRAALEPVLEIFQHKGDSECMNGLSGILGAPDELCDFEKRGRRVVDGDLDCGDVKGNLGSALSGCMSRHDFARGILASGFKEAERLGVNPFQLGFIGSSDTHNGTPGLVAEAGFRGHRGTDDGTDELLLGTGALTPGGVYFNPGGLAGVWAEENSRDAIFAALRRREVFATSGPRIVPRVFAGWALPEDICDDPNMVRQGYEKGVPMGGVLRPAAGATSPQFAVSALRDSGTPARPGTKLQRLQIVKVWFDGAQAHQKVFDIAGSATRGSDLDVATCTPSSDGADSMCAVWSDPEFDPTQRAAYYVRVVENPSCRWDAFACMQYAGPARPATCDDPQFPKRIQERAWTSPIWIEPA